MARKKIIIVNGSPRKKGNSATLAKQVANGAEGVGAAVESFYLQGMNIRTCTACGTCRKDREIDCEIEDDMGPLYPKLRQADALVIAGPIYYFTVSAQTKLFMDRCYALGGPQGNALAGKNIGIILVYGGADPFTSGAINALRMFQDAYRYVGANLAGMVYGSASDPGEIASNQALMSEAYNLGGMLGKS